MRSPGMEETASIASWTPPDNNGNVSASAFSLGRYWYWHGQAGPWDGSTLVTITSLGQIVPFSGIHDYNHRFLGLRKSTARDGSFADTATAWEWMPGDSAPRDWDSFLTADTVCDFRLNDIAHAANKADLEQVYDGRVVNATFSDTGAVDVLFEQGGYNPAGPNNIWFQESGFGTFIAYDGGIVLVGQGMRFIGGSPLGVYTWDSYEGSPHPPDPPSPLPTVTVTKGGNNGWIDGTWQ